MGPWVDPTSWPASAAPPTDATRTGKGRCTRRRGRGTPGASGYWWSAAPMSTRARSCDRRRSTLAARARRPERQKTRSSFPPPPPTHISAITITKPLIGLKNIFAQQLPNRPKAYIVRLLMDGIHKSMMFIRDNHVIGGITYRAFARQSFGEIAFCAITPEEQAKGYATRLMNRLKQHARDVDGLTYLLTHADNKAVGYFIKQGFTKEITLETERWHGFIKNYENAILMEFKLDPKLPYSDLPNMILQQKQVAQTLLQASCVMLGTWRHECGLDTCQTRVDLIPIQTCAVEEVVKRFSTNHIKYPGIEIQKDEAGIPRNPIIVENIPGLREAGWTPDQWGHSQFREISVPYTAAYRQQLNACMRDLLKRLNENPDAWPFLKPVDACAVPGYYDIIKDPMDLSTVSKRLESERYYVTFNIFLADIKRIFKNARTYNSPGSVYYECANRLEKFFSGEVQEAHPFLMSSKIS